MAEWRVNVSYWCGFTGDRDWQERARGLFAAQGWTDIRFGNRHTPDYVPFSSNVDADEIHFVVGVERLDRETVERVLGRVGIQHTAYITIREREAE
jgi:hypothetical protein